MAKDPCESCCRGCTSMLVEAIGFLVVFAAVIVATVYPLLGN